MYRVFSPDLAHVLLDGIEFVVERDPDLPGVWTVLPSRTADPGIPLGVFLAVRQARHCGFTVWSTASAGHRIGYGTNPINACDEVLRFDS